MGKERVFHLKGKIKWFNEDKGFGFAVPDGIGLDVLVHTDSLEAGQPDGFKAGQRVYLEVIKPPSGGYMATSVIRID